MFKRIRNVEFTNINVTQTLSAPQHHRTKTLRLQLYAAKKPSGRKNAGKALREVTGSQSVSLGGLA